MVIYKKQSLLCDVCFSKESKSVQLLLNHGANVNAVNAKNQSALHVSVHKNQPECCKVLIEKGCDPNLKVLI